MHITYVNRKLANRLDPAEVVSSQSATKEMQSGGNSFGHLVSDGGAVFSERRIRITLLHLQPKSRKIAVH